MSELKKILVDELQDLLSAENQIVNALPKMIDAAHNGKLKEVFEKHRVQTEGQIQRLNESLQLIGEDAESKLCKGMKGLLEEGEETIEDGKDLDELAADLALIAAAQKVEHYEIAGYGTARTLARQLGEREVAVLLSHTLGEEESADYLLTEVTKPLLQQALSQEAGSGIKTPWGEPGETASRPVAGQSKARAAAVGGTSATKTKKTKS